MSWEYFCLGVSFLGLFVRVMTVAFVPRHTSGRNTKRQIAEDLNTSGIYSIVRHPLYLGNFLIGLGISLVRCVVATGDLQSCILAVLRTDHVCREAFLRQKFGDVYRRWAAQRRPFGRGSGNGASPVAVFVAQCITPGIHRLDGRDSLPRGAGILRALD